MKINSLLQEGITAASSPENAQSPAPKFGRSDKFLEEKDEETVEECTTAGSVATVDSPVGGMQRRGKGSIFAGIKTSDKYPNSKQVKESQLNEVDPRNFDSDVDYYAALKAPARQRSAPSDYPYSQADDDAYFREIFRKKRLAAQQAEREADHDRLATGTNEGEEFGTFSALKDWQVWNVHVYNNYYRGKYADYGPRLYSVVAGSPEEARQVVLDNAEYVLQDLLSRKLQSGKKVLPRGSALPVEDKRVGKAEPGSITTVGFKEMLTPEGPMKLKFLGGKIVASEEGQEVEEARVGNRMSDISVGSPKIVNYKRKAVGEVGIDHEPSPGNGPYYWKHYLTGKYMVGYDTKQQALADLKDVVMQYEGGELEEGLGADTAKLLGIPVVAGALAVGAGHLDKQQPHVEIGGQSAKIIRADSTMMPRDTMLLKGADGKMYHVWMTSGKGSGHALLASPAEEVKEASWDKEGSWSKQMKRQQKKFDKTLAADEKRREQRSQERNDLYKSTMQGIKGNYSDESHPIKNDGNEGRPGKQNYPGKLDEKSKSQAQFRTMAAVAHNPEFAKKVGIKQSVGKEFHKADKGADYKSLPKKVDEAEVSEDKLASDLYKDLQIFKKGADKDIGAKAKDKEIGNKPKDKDIVTKEDCWDGYQQIGMKKKGDKQVPNCVPVKEEFDGEYDDEAGSTESNLLTTARAVKGLLDTIEDKDNLPEWVQEKIAKAEGMLVASWDYLQSQKEQGVDPQVDEDWQKTNRKDKTDGMSPKAVKAYRRENPGSKLQTAVTKKPSELKAGSKDAKRRKSFCARMSGVEGPMKDENGKPTPKAKALKRWNC